MRSVFILLAVLVLSFPGAAKAGTCENLCDEDWWESASVETLQQELANGAGVNARDKDGLTPLHFAAAYGTSEIIEVLIKAGADIRARDKNGKLPVDLAEGNDKVKDTDIYWKLHEGRF